ncbi:uncharacterized protein TEOVI_000220800 [Trypanosoma equiperdum]|uniref:Uncharacterized protein n=4 Tax=Trypanozoon TaxID=39700 RepID=Q582V1_TRYB2|nr:hypothetical protein, conserved [Trypanosoma brucei gambiense DAL972]XP_843832.1 hypothetical protein, conserved [Trypanosoma brucei brucei TREU927]AAX80681.1 hypothetical protein, conserved [Trypanosoma brucei]RHW73477.1 hypothetical protein DPX39_030022800 [Trypanosoma brucei equiperdum]SCU70634.1 hypothetical protein, conserved [Trypanosoma equiperdum]AAZ10273.1 hypothetical protein, conserved [Trypanosoma brucei brucei TREU927]CBH09898.1 hypothetical protein, conserved [Trypanosoma bru|eukprot:XP_011772191.1 hypothetical protein, conserved [Trypanosoma brucei gambiense DAL972]
MEKNAHGLLADADSPKAHRHIRNTLKVNKLSSALMFMAVVTPVMVLVSFYSAKLEAVREKWVDPYELPPGFNPKTGRFMSDSKPQGVTEPPAPLLLRGAVPGATRQ